MRRRIGTRASPLIVWSNRLRRGEGAKVNVVIEENTADGFGI